MLIDVIEEETEVENKSFNGQQYIHRSILSRRAGS